MPAVCRGVLWSNVGAASEVPGARTPWKAEASRYSPPAASPTFGTSRYCEKQSNSLTTSTQAYAYASGQQTGHKDQHSHWLDTWSLRPSSDASWRSWQHSSRNDQHSDCSDTWWASSAEANSQSHSGWQPYSQLSSSHSHGEDRRRMLFFPYASSTHSLVSSSDLLRANTSLWLVCSAARPVAGDYSL